MYLKYTKVLKFNIQQKKSITQEPPTTFKIKSLAISTLSSASNSRNLNHNLHRNISCPDFGAILALILP